LIAASSWRSGARAGRPADYVAHPLDYATPWLGFRVLRELNADDVPEPVR
jgi:formylglycine-generating enzyme required for sulfatase activity